MSRFSGLVSTDSDRTTTRRECVPTRSRSMSTTFARMYTRTESESLESTRVSTRSDRFPFESSTARFESTRVSTRFVFLWRESTCSESERVRGRTSSARTNRRIDRVRFECATTTRLEAWSRFESTSVDFESTSIDIESARAPFESSSTRSRSTRSHRQSTRLHIQSTGLHIQSTLEQRKSGRARRRSTGWSRPSTLDPRRSAALRRTDARIHLVSSRSPTRRQLLQATGALGASTLLACRAGSSSSGPSIVSITSRRVTQSLPGIATVDGAGVHLTRIIGQPALRHLDPFVLLDRMHSDDPSAYVRGFQSSPRLVPLRSRRYGDRAGDAS